MLVWSSAQQAVVGANKSNDYTYDFSEILGEELDEAPVVIPTDFTIFRREAE